MRPTPFENALTQYEAAEEDGSPERWAQAADAAASVADGSRDDSEASYLAGLCAYYANDVPATHRYLLHALSLKPSHAFARLYLGHQLYDESRFGEALETFQHVDGAAFLDIDQHWRALKLDELVLCCRLHLGDANLVPDVTRLVEVYRQSAEVEKALPAEIVECVGSLDLSTMEDSNRIGHAVLGLAEAEGMEAGAALIRRKLQSVGE